MNNIVERLREANGQSNNERLVILCAKAADEIERLRAELDKSNTAYLQLHDLVTTWADADLHVTPYGPSIHPIVDAEHALRKAVGR